MADRNEGLRLAVEFITGLIEEAEKGCEPIIVRHIPTSLTKDFEEKVVKPCYSHPGEPLGTSWTRTIEDLMLKAIEIQKEKEKKEEGQFMDEEKNTPESDIIVTEDSSLIDLLRALVAKADGKTVKVVKKEA